MRISNSRLYSVGDREKSSACQTVRLDLAIKGVWLDECETTSDAKIRISTLLWTIKQKKK